MPDPKVHAGVRNSSGRLVALCRHIARPRLSDRRRDVTCEACRAKLEHRPRRRLRRGRV